MESTPQQPSGPADPDPAAAPGAATFPGAPGTAAGPAVPEQRTASGAPPPAPPTHPGVAGYPAAPGAASGGSPAPRWSRVRLVLAVVAGVLVLLCVGGLGVGYVLYDEATKPNRSAPDVAVDNYLRAYFVDRNPVRSDEMTCSSPDLGSIQALRAEIETQEDRLDAAIAVTWGALGVQKQGEDTALVRTSLRRSATVDGSTQSLVDDWRFRVVEEDGWRVCGAERLG